MKLQRRGNKDEGMKDEHHVELWLEENGHYLTVSS